MSRRSRQLVYYPTAGTPDPGGWEPASADIHTLRWGYNLADLDRLARASLWRVWGIHLDYQTRYDLAWSAIAERLYLASAAEPPSPNDLITAGQDAIAAHVDAEQRHHGYDRERSRDMPRFAAYWNGRRHVPEPAAPLIERLALWQIWPELTQRQRDVFLALAACGTYQAAAEYLGISARTFSHHLEAGRLRFFRLWYEHETPPPFWGSGRRVYLAGGPKADAPRRLATNIRRRKPRTGKTEREPRHGTLREYNYWGCRCGKCAAVKSAESERRRRKDGAAVRRFMTASDFADAVRRNEAGETWASISESTGFSEGYLRRLRNGTCVPVPDAEAAA